MNKLILLVIVLINSVVFATPKKESFKILPDLPEGTREWREDEYNSCKSHIEFAHNYLDGNYDILSKCILNTATRNWDIGLVLDAARSCDEACSSKILESDKRYKEKILVCRAAEQLYKFLTNPHDYIASKISAADIQFILDSREKYVRDEERARIEKNRRLDEEEAATHEYWRQKLYNPPLDKDKYRKPDSEEIRIQLW